MKNKFLTFLFVVGLPITVAVIIYFNLAKNSTQPGVQTSVTTPTTTGSASTSSKAYTSTQPTQASTVRAAKSTRVS